MALGRQTDMGVRYVLDVTDNTRPAVAADAKIRQSAQATGRVLKTEQAAQVKRLREQGLSYAAIAKQMGFSATKARQLANATSTAAREQVAATHRVEAADRSRAATSRRTAVSVERDHRSILSSWGTMSRRIIGYGAAIGSAYLGFNQAKTAITNTQALAKQTSFLTRQTGLDVKTSSEWAATAKLRGIEAKALNTVFATLAKNTGAAARGGASQIETFNALGISQRQLKEAGDDYAAVLALVADGLAETEGGAGRTEAASRLLGRGFQTLEPILAGGAKGMEDILHRADELGATFTGKTLPAQLELIKSQRDLKLAGMGLQVAFGKFVTPALQDVSDEAVHLAEVLNDPKLTPEEKFKAFTDALGDIIPDDLPEDIASAIGKAGPGVAREITHLAGVATEALLDEFKDADIGTKLSVLALAGWKFGLFGAIARKSGAALLAAWRTESVGQAIATTTAAQTGRALPGRMRGALSRLGPLGKAGGLVLGGAIVTGAIIALDDGKKPIGDVVQDLFASLGIGEGSKSPLERLFEPSKVPGVKGVADFQKAFEDDRALKNIAGMRHELQGVQSIIEGLGKPNAPGPFGNGLSPSEINDARHRMKDIRDDMIGRTKEMSGGWGDLQKNTSKSLSTITRDADREGTATTASVGKHSKEAAADGSGWFRKLRGNVGKSMDSTRQTVSSIIGEIGGDLNAALRGLGADPVSLGVAAGAVGRAAGKGAEKKAAGGWIGRRGAAGRDTVPTMLGMGEAVLNRHQQGPVDSALRATYGFGLDGLFSRERRPHYMAKGGKVGQYDLGSVESMLNSRFGLSTTSGFRPGDDGFHGSNQARDLGGSSSAMARASAYIMSSGLWRHLAEGIHNPGLSVDSGQQVSPSFWGASTWADHIDHIHIAITSGFSAALGAAAAEKLKALQVSGPAGALKALAQGGADKVTRAANAYLAKNAPVAGSGSGARGIDSAGGSYDKARLAALAKSVGMADPNLMAAVALAESGGNPRSLNQNTNGTWDAGLWQINQIHGYPQSKLFDPAYNARAAKAILGRQGIGAWAAYNNGSYRQFLQRGGFAGWYGAGGQFVADGPQLVGVGDGGPELVTVQPMAKGGLVGRIGRLGQLPEIDDRRAPKPPKQREFKPPKGASEDAAARAQEKFEKQAAKEQKKYEAEAARFQKKQQHRVKQNQQRTRKQDKLIDKFTDGLDELGVGQLVDMDASLEKKVGKTKNKKKKKTFQRLLERVDTRLTNRASNAIDEAEFGVSLAQSGLEGLAIQQQLQGVFETQAGGQARASYITSQIIPAMQRELGALNDQLAAARATGDAELVRSTLLAIADEQNQIAQQQLDAQEATKVAAEETADALKEFSGATGFNFRSQGFTDDLASLLVGA